MKAYLNPANAVTAARYLALPLFCHWLDRKLYLFAVLAIMVCALLDLLDGAVARKLDCASGFGEIFDAVTDGVCYGYFIVLLGLYQRIPWRPATGILALGLINVVLRTIYALRVGCPTNYRSYAMERVVAYVAFLCGLAAGGFETEYFANLCVLVMLIVLVHDAKRMVFDPPVA